MPLTALLTGVMALMLAALPVSPPIKGIALAWVVGAAMALAFVVP